MIDITQAENVRYGSGHEVVVYSGFGDSNLKYIVPVPRFVYQEDPNGGDPLPAFSLLEYVVAGGDRRGTLAFSVELHIPEDARQAVERRFPEARFGQLDWQEAQVFLDFTVPQKGRRFYVASPSLAGTNQATYILSLDSSEDLDFIIANFGEGAPAVSQLHLRYDVTTLTRLRKASATVSFDVEKAMDYERTLEPEQSSWGTVRNRKETIRQHLKSSNSGSTKIDYGTNNPSDELRKRMNNWAFTTLEGLVQDAVEEAANRLGPGNADRMSARYMASFSRSYQENHVIEWAIAPETLLPAAEISGRWNDHHEPVDFRNLMTSFCLLGDLQSNSIDRVDLTATYRDVTKTFRFEQGGETTKTFRADGRQTASGEFDPKFSYEFTVYFEDGREFASDTIESTNTQVTLNLNELGLVEVELDGSNLDWNQLDRLAVGFFFQPPAERAPIHETRILRSDNPVAVFESRHMTRISDFAFDYELTFRLKEGSVVRQAPVRQAGASAQRRVLLDNPLRETTFSITVDNPQSGPRITRGRLTATYEDEVNGIDFHQPVNFESQGRNFFEKKVPVNAVFNPSGSFLRLNGNLLMEGTNPRPLTNIYLPGRDTNLPLTPGQWPHSVAFDPFQVDWAGGVRRADVYVSSARAKDGGGYARGFPSITLTFAPVLDEDGEVLLGRTTPPQYFTFPYEAGTQATYIYDIRYSHAEGPPSYTAETTASRGVVMLPRDGDSQSPVQHVVVEPTEVTTEVTTAHRLVD